MVKFKAFGSVRPKESLRAKGDAARDRYDWRAAGEFYRRHLEQEPDDAAIWVQFGHCNKETGDREEAERAYLRALSLEPGNADTCVQLGHVEKLAGRPEQALGWYRKALAIDASLESARHEVAETTALLTPQEGSAATPASSLDERVAAEIDRRFLALADQVGAIKAVAVELQRLRRTVEGLDARTLQLQASVASAREAQDATRDAHAERLGVLEARTPATQHAFPALLSQLSELNAHRDEIELCRSKIEAVERRLEAPRQ